MTEKVYLPPGELYYRNLTPSFSGGSGVSALTFRERESDWTVVLTSMSFIRGKLGERTELYTQLKVL